MQHPLRIQNIIERGKLTSISGARVQKQHMRMTSLHNNHSLLMVSRGGDTKTLRKNNVTSKIRN